ncbi:MBL fold metallo-hydrolase [Kordiimonas sp. SCSIO 12610]|uniref:MBL fold metallo-hydrolase n=1 Tax=Kordiimonas sp. SCSIO 12610 TaxID=2829597 RepID=UPI00210D17C2|nr:MBL fold metallo-hydrolase [Kordiimonas sp. SCSIO 12610]UTW55022.1 MBL fold metallo-hydrolase [Kordiimonas sp. SCSIO 12610]
MQKTKFKPSPLVSASLKTDVNYGTPEEIIPGVVRILADNAKDYTGPGTNTYFVGDEDLWIIDPGPDDQEHIDAIVNFVGARTVKGIFITHTHLDHSPAAKPLKARFDASVYSFGKLSSEIMALTDEDVDPDFVTDVELADGAIVGDGEWQIIARHTPGHFPNHMCYFLPNKKVMFSGDHVMGWSTTAVVPPLGHLGEYLESLDKLEADNSQIMLPSHGLVIDDPKGRIQDIRDHRYIRHQQIQDCLKLGITSPADIVDKIYEGLTPRLIEAAQGQVQAHLELIDMPIRVSS